MDLRVSDNQGFAALIGVLIFGTIAVTTASALVFAGIRSARAFLVFQQSYEAKGIARACVDTALRALHQDTGYAGSGSVTLGQGTCDYVVTETGVGSREIVVTGTVDTIIKQLQITIDQLSPTIHVSSWREG